MIVTLLRFQLFTETVLDGLIIMFIHNISMFNMLISIFRTTRVSGIAKSSGKSFCHGKLVDAVNVYMSLNRFKL